MRVPISNIGRRLAPRELVVVTAMRGRFRRALHQECRIVLARGHTFILIGKLEGRGIGPRSRGWTAYQVFVYLRECERIRVTVFLRH